MAYQEVDAAVRELLRRQHAVLQAGEKFGARGCSLRIQVIVRNMQVNHLAPCLRRLVRTGRHVDLRSVGAKIAATVGAYCKLWVSLYVGR